MYRLLLSLYPRSFRARYGAEMARAYADRRHAARARGLWALSIFTIGALRDLVANASAEHLAARRLRQGRTGWMGRIGEDVRHALRILRRTPAVTALTALTFAVGVGSITAVTSLVDAVLIQPLPFPRPMDVVAIQGRANGEPAGISFENLRDLGAGAASLQAWSPFFTQSVNLTGVAEPDRLRGGFVTSGFFTITGVTAALGRTFGSEADAPNSLRVAVLTDATWRHRFGGRADIVGQTIHLNNQGFVVSGVLPPSFTFPIDYAEVFVPIWTTTASIARDSHNYLGLGRLRTGVTTLQAAAEMEALAASLAATFAETNRGRSATVERLSEVLARDTTDSLRLLTALAGIMLVAACASVAGLQVGALARRRREMAIRAAVGGGRWRIVREILAESVARATLGAALGVIVAYGGIRFIVVSAPQDIYGIDRAALGLLPLLVGTVAAVVAGVAAGLPAALSWARQEGLAILGSGDRAPGDPGTSRLRRALVVSQMAVAALLLVCAGLSLRSFVSLVTVDPGFDPERVLTLEYRLPRNKYVDAAAQQAFHDQVLERVRAVPGVIAAAGVRALPFSGNGNFADYRTAAGGEQKRASFNAVSPNYFDTMRIPLLSGRSFEAGNHRDLVVIVSRSLAEREWPNDSAIGRSLYFDGVGRATVLGVVKDVRHRELAETSLAAVYSLQSQNPSVFNTLAIRTAGDPMSVAQDVRRAVWSLDPDQPMWKIRSLDSLLAASLSTQRFLLQLIGFFAISAAALAVLGLYGIVATTVAGRTREIGVRLALGATPGSILMLVLRSGIALALVGVGAGLTLAFLTSRLLAGFLFGITAHDPLTFLSAGLLLAAATALACTVPGLRALTIDPVVALRQ